MLSTTTDVVIGGALDGLALRHRAYVNNLANVETPGFQPSDVKFEEQLRSVRDRLDLHALDPDSPPALDLSTSKDAQQADRADGNGVQVDTQVMKLEENSLTYQALATAARSRGQILLSAITEGRK
jgi:flagellar basal-body rod protein FlgB